MTTAFHRPTRTRLACLGTVTALTAALTFGAALPAQAAAPVGGADAYSVTQDEPLTVGAPGVWANDSDPEGDAIAFHSIQGPAGGILPGEEFNTLAGGGAFTYYPPTGFTGTRVWSYRLNDAADVSDWITVTFTVTAPPAPAGNQAPVGTADGYNVAQDGSFSLPAPGLLANDTDPDGDPLTLVAQGYANGSLPGEAMTTWPDGSLFYLAPTGYTGTREWWYEVSDGTHTVKVPIVFTIAPAPAGNTAPVANGDSYAIPAATPFDSPAPGVLLNDTDAEGDTLSIAVVQPQAGGALPGESLVLDLDGGIHYVPPTGFVGTRSWRYKVSDGYTLSSYAQIDFQIAAAPVANTAPTAVPDAYPVIQDTDLVVGAPGVLANDSDADGDAIAAGWTAEPIGGKLPGEAWTLAADGSFVYTPPTGYVGSRTWMYQVHDAEDDSAFVAVTFTITGAAEPEPEPEPTDPMLPTLPTTPTATGGAQGGKLASTGMDGAGVAGTAGLAGLLVAGGLLARRFSRREA